MPPEPRPGDLQPVADRVRWIAGGLFLQVVAFMFAAAIVYQKYQREDLLGEVGKYTLRLAWHDTLRSPEAMGLVVVWVGVYLIGAMAVARPFVWRPAHFWIAVPIAALAGVLIFGVFMLVLAIVFTAVDGSGDLWIFGGWGGSSKKTEPADEHRQGSTTPVS